MQTKYIYPIIVMCGMLILMASCRKDDINSMTEDDIPPTEVFTKTGVTGQVLDNQGAPIQNIDINLITNGQTQANTQTNEYGFFRFEDVALNEEGALLHLEGAGYYENFKFVYPELNAQAWTSVYMVDKELTQQFKATEDVNIIFQNQAEIQFDANSIANVDGTTYQGDVNLYAYWYNPDEATFLDQAPGDLRAENANGNQVQLVSYGMMAIEIFDNAGNELNIKEGNTAQLTFPLSSNSSEVPEEMPLWYFNEQEGVWLEEGVATNNGSALIAEVSHFSFWNCDLPFEVVTIKGKIESIDRSLAEYRIEVCYENFRSGSTYTNSAGCFEGKVPKGIPLTLKVQSKYLCEDNYPIIYQEDYVFEEDTDLGNLEITLPEIGEYFIQTEIKNCGNELVPFAYLILEMGSSNYILQSDENGKVEEYVTLCGLLGDSNVKAVDLNLREESQVISFEFDQNNTAIIPEIIMCEEPNYFLQLIMPGSNTLMKNPQLFILDGSNYFIYSYDYITGSHLSLIIDFASEPIKIVRGSFALYENGIGVGPSGICNESPGPNEGDCATMRIVGIRDGDGINEKIGTIDGYWDNNSATSLIISFYLPIEAEELERTTVDVKVWMDENGNGIQDAGEPNPTDEEWRKATTAVAPKSRFRNAMFSSEGSYENSLGILSYEVLADEWVRLQLDDPEPITLQNAGDDAIDNDFSPATSETDQMYIPKGMPITEIGLGLVSNSGFSCHVGPSGSYCAPTTILATVSGGVSPYEYLWNNGATSNGFPVQDGGTYSVTVTDFDGATCESSFELSQSGTRVHGFVFVDEDGGTDNVYDPAIDSKLEGVDFFVTSSNDDIILEQVSSDGDGNFEILSLEHSLTNYHFLLESEVQGYELLEPNATTDESLDNDLNPNCKNCLPFLLNECDGEFEITVGFRRI